MAITVTPRSDGDPCPRVEISFDWIPGANRVEVWRRINGVASEVRGGRITASAPYVDLVDYEVPLGVSVTYEAIGRSGGGIAGTTGESDWVSVQSPHTDPSWVWLQDPLEPATAMALPMGGGSARQRRFTRPVQIVRNLRTRDATMISGLLGEPEQIEFALYAESGAISAQLEELFAQAAPVLLRSSRHVPLPHMAYLAIEEFEADPMDAHDAPDRDWTIWRFAASVVRAPAASVVLPVHTYQEVLDIYPTYGDLLASKATYRDVLRDPRLGA